MTTAPAFPETDDLHPEGGSRPILDDDILNEDAPNNSPPHGDTSEDQVRAVIADWAEGIRHKNVERVARHFIPEPVCYDLAPPLVADQPLRENLREWFATFAGDIGYEIQDLSVFTSGDLAYSHSLHHLTGQKVQGDIVDLWFRETFGFQKIGGSWLIHHSHESVPFLMDGSGRAALNLQPV